MKTIKAYPPNYEEICQAFPYVRERKTLVFTYGDIIYKPGKGVIPTHLRVHEVTHANQQGDDPAGWWKRYLEEPEFRLDQEVKAYRKQWEYIDRFNHNYWEKRELFEKITDDLSSEVYGNMISKAEAVRLISNEKQ
jgi:hypothetical protein